LRSKGFRGNSPSLFALQKDSPLLKAGAKEVAAILCVLPVWGFFDTLSHPFGWLSLVSNMPKFVNIPMQIGTLSFTFKIQMYIILAGGVKYGYFGIHK